jgi:phage gp37-like protein
MIAEQAQDLYSKIVSVPGLAGSVGLALGGKATDPNLAKVSLPAAWVVFTGDKPIEPDYPVVPKIQSVLVSFSVMVFVAYDSQSDLISNQYPLLDSCVTAVHGTDSPAGTRWKFEGRSCKLINPDRLGYELKFTVNAMI